MSKNKTKHIGEKIPLNQDSEPANYDQNNTGDSNENPIKPIETQKDINGK